MINLQNPQVQSIQPTRGPVSGGTLLTVYGSQLNTGRNIAVSLKDKDCSVQLLAVTSSSFYIR